MAQRGVHLKQRPKEIKDWWYKMQGNKAERGGVDRILQLNSPELVLQMVVMGLVW